MIKNLPSNAGDSASIPGWETKIPHAAGQLSPHVATRKEDPVKQKKKGFFFNHLLMNMATFPFSLSTYTYNNILSPLPLLLKSKLQTC